MMNYIHSQYLKNQIHVIAFNFINAEFLNSGL